MKHSNKISQLLPFVAIGILAAVVIINSGCNERKIYYDKEKASNQVIPITQARILEMNFINSRHGLDSLSKDSAVVRNNAIREFISKRYNAVNAETFGRDAIALLLDQPGADSIRIYYGMDAKGVFRLVLLPVDGKGKDIMREMVGKRNAVHFPGIPAAYAKDGDSYEAVETGQTCPPCLIDGGN